MAAHPLEIDAFLHVQLLQTACQRFTFVESVWDPSQSFPAQKFSAGDSRHRGKEPKAGKAAAKMA